MKMSLKFAATVAIACVFPSIHGQSPMAGGKIQKALELGDEDGIDIPPTTGKAQEHHTLVDGSVTVVAKDIATKTTTIEESETIPLPSLDQVMHEDAPAHGRYNTNSGEIRSFCGRHNHFGPNSGCEQHTMTRHHIHHSSLRGRRSHGQSAEDDSERLESPSYLQQHLQRAVGIENKQESSKSDVVSP